MRTIWKVAAIAVVLVTAACGDDSTDEANPVETTAPSEVLGFEPNEILGGSSGEAGPGKVATVSCSVAPGEALRVAVNAQGRVDLHVYLAVLDSELDQFDDALPEPVSDSLRSWSNSIVGELDDRFGDLPEDMVYIQQSSADDWDDLLTVDTALTDDVNVVEEGSFYEARLAWVSPTDTSCIIVAIADEDVDVEFVSWNHSDSSAVDALSGAGSSVFAPSLYSDTFPMYSEFFNGFATDAIDHP